MSIHAPDATDVHNIHELDFHRFIIENLPIAVFTVDAAMKITSFNNLAEQLTGYAADEAIGCYCGDILKSSVCRSNCLLKKIDYRQNAVMRVESTILTKSGKTIPVGLNTAAFINNNGIFTGGVDAFLDLRPLKALERERDNFTSMIAHDIKSSMVIIGGFVRRLVKKSEKTDSEKHEEYIEIIRKEISKLESLIKDFIDFSRLRSGNMEMHFSPTSLDSELMDLHEMYAPQAREAGVVLELHNEKTLSVIYADMNHLKRVFCNLLDNAIKYSQGKGKIIMTTQETDSHVIVEIEDHGDGIAPHELSRIFEPFHRGRGINKKEGFGIGLSIVHAVVKEHGGDVLVKSTPGEGSLFTVVLPKTIDYENRETGPR